MLAAEKVSHWRRVISGIIDGVPTKKRMFPHKAAAAMLAELEEQVIGFKRERPFLDVANYLVMYHAERHPWIALVAAELRAGVARGGATRPDTATWQMGN